MCLFIVLLWLEPLTYTLKKRVNLNLSKIFKFSVNNLYIFEKCVGKLIKKGNRFFIHNTLLSVLCQFKIKSEVPTLIFYEFLIIIKPLVVAKWVSKGFGHRTEYYQIPYVAGVCFQTKLALKWVYIAAKKNNFVSLESSLFDEISKTITGHPCIIFSLKRRLYLTILKNRAAADFKW